MRFTNVMAMVVLCLSLPGFAATDEKASDEALIAAAEKLVAESKAEIVSSFIADGAAATQAQAPVPTETSAATEVKESEIPVIIKATAAPKTEDSQMVWRLVASIGMIVVVGSVLIFTTRRWARQKDKGGQKARIEMMHQMQLGTKRSLALVRVAGEVMLIGITDHNINMIKAVTLIDEETEAAFKTGFNNFLEDEFSIEDVRNALNPRA